MNRMQLFGSGDLPLLYIDSFCGFPTSNSGTWFCLKITGELLRAGIFGNYSESQRLRLVSCDRMLGLRNSARIVETAPFLPVHLNILIASSLSEVTRVREMGKSASIASKRC